MKKVLVVLLAVVFMTVAFSACATNPPAESSKAPAASTVSEASVSPSVSATPAPPKTIHEKSWEEIKAAAKNQKLVFFCWWGEAFWTQTCADFKAKYGIDVTFVMGDGAASADKLIAEKPLKEASIDVFTVGGGQILQTLNGEVFEKNVCKLLPEIGKLDANLQKVQEGVKTDGTLIPLYLNQTGILYNPEKVTNPPQTFAELEAWIEANPNRFGVTTPDGGSGEAFCQTVIGSLTGGLDQYAGATAVDAAKVAKWDAVWKWYIDRKDKIVLTKSNSDSRTRMASGEIWMTVQWADSTFTAMKKGELPKKLVFYIPKMGLPGGGDTIGIAANSKNKEAALLFADYLTSAQIQIQMAEALSISPVRSDVRITNTVISSKDLENRTLWIPVCYKIEFKKQFLVKVLQQG